MFMKPLFYLMVLKHKRIDASESDVPKGSYKVLPLSVQVLDLEKHLLRLPRSMVRMNLLYVKLEKEKNPCFVVEPEIVKVTLTMHISA